MSERAELGHRLGFRLGFRDGGWVLLVAAILVVGIILWAFAGVLSGHRRVGGGDVASYGFDLSTLLVPADAITPSGQPRDFLRPLTVERTMLGRSMVEFNSRTRKRYLVSDDRVIGVRLGGATRAYPLYLLNGHEVIEDTLDGVPVAVTYSPLCDAIGVYDRRVGERTLELRVSGLLHNANSLYYDDGPTPSLWRQVDGKAISGPFAASKAVLAPIGEICLTTWADWLAAAPDTDVPERDGSLIRLYEGISYVRDHQRPAIGFPVEPSPPTLLTAKAPVLLLRRGPVTALLAFERMRERAKDGVVTIDLGGLPVDVHLPRSAEAAWRLTHAGDEPVQAQSMFWFTASSTLGIERLEP